MPVEAKKTEAIINAIRVLRSRRVRPSGQKIAWYLKRQNFIDEEATVEALDSLVRSCDILRVEYKGATSYRVAKSRSSKCSSKTPVFDGHSVRRAILSSVANCGTSGGSRHRIAACLQTRGLGKLVDRLDVILQRETRVGVLTKKVVNARDGRSVTIYALSSRSDDTNRDNQSSSSDTENTGDDDKTRAPFEHLQLQLKLLQQQKNGNDLEETTKCVKDNDTQNVQEYKTILEDYDKTGHIEKATRRGRPRKCPLEEKIVPKRKGRPPSKRAKKEKKVYDPSEGGSKGKQNGATPGDMSPISSDNCSVCNTNENDILCCMLCSTKAHPKCVGYGEELANKIVKSPWTCMDCKSCSICKFNHSIGTLIFCDKCDRAFHQTCHFPPVADFPNGAWVCFICLPRVEDNVYESLIPWLPTPVSSPERDESSSGSLETGELIVPNAANWDVASGVEYFQKIGFDNFANILKEQEIDGHSLMIISRDDVVNGLGLKLGPALRFFREIRILQTRLSNPPF